MRNKGIVIGLAAGLFALSGVARANQQNLKILFGRYTVSGDGWFVSGGSMLPESVNGQLRFDGVGHVCGSIQTYQLEAPNGRRCTYIVNSDSTKNYVGPAMSYEVWGTGVGNMSGTAVPTDPACGGSVQFVATLGVSSAEQFSFAANDVQSDQESSGVGIHQHGVDLFNYNVCY